MSVPPRVEVEVPAAEYRPRFVLWASLLAQLPLNLFLAIWAGGFFGGLFQSLLPGVASALRAATGVNPFALIGTVVLVGFPIVCSTIKKLNYRTTVYRVFHDRLVIDEGFFTQHRKEVPLQSVREINLRRGLLQRLIGLGSVYLATQATGTGQSWSASSVLGGSSTFGSGALMRDLVQSEEAYTLLRSFRPGAPSS